jgi:spermidine synthase
MTSDNRVIRSAGPAACLFFLSGTGALVAESAWQRMLLLVFGASATGTTVILTAVFLGLALGSLVGGRLLSRVRDAARFYAGAQLAIGFSVLVVPVLLRAADHLQLTYLQENGSGDGAHFILRLLLCLGAVLPATLGMGATVPAMNRMLAEHSGRVGDSVALVGGINTLGAVLGCLATGFVLIDRLGTSASLTAAAACNLAVGLLALWVFRPGAGATGTPSSAAAFPPRETETAAPAGLRRLLPWLYFLTSMLALGYEIVWLRLLGLYNTSSFATFTLTLAVYLGGSALGGLLVYRWLARRLDGLAIFALGSLGTGATALLGLAATYAMPGFNRQYITIPGNAGTLTMGGVLTVEAVYALVVVLLPSVFLGLAFPAVCQVLVARRSETDLTSGRIFCLGNVGAAAGVLLVGLWVIPSVGLIRTGALMACLNGLVGLALLAGFPSAGAARWRVLKPAGLLVLAVGLAFAFRAPPPFRIGRLVLAADSWLVQPVAQAGAAPSLRVLAQHDGPSATVTVVEPVGQPAGEPVRRIYVDGQLVASTDAGSKVDSKMLAHLPLLLHPDPKRALTVGFGSGGTSWSMAQHGIQVDCAEIEPEVIRAAPWFESQNGRVLDLPNVRVILDDARHHLHMTPLRYDVIATDVTNLQYKQNGYLYTREYFELMRSRLTPDGIACAWVPMAAITGPEFRTLLQSFAAVYAHPSLWFINSTETNFAILLGTPGPLRIDLARVEQGFASAAIRHDLREINVVHPYQFVHFLHLEEDGFRRYAGDAPLHTDDRPILEFTSPLSFYQKAPTFTHNLLETLRGRPRDYAPFLTGRAADPGLFAKYGADSDLHSQIILGLSVSRLPLTEASMRDQMQAALRCAQQSLALFPDNPFALASAGYFQSRLDAVRVK